MANQSSLSGANGHARPESGQQNGVTANGAPQGSLTTSHVDPTHQEHSQIETVGWAFVQQYYVTMGSNPHKLEHFYNKASSQTWGEETKVVTTTVGRSDIAKRFQEIAFKDAKVRLTNVDCQGTIGNSIIVQVIGECSNDNQASRKFAQTFVLVPQKPEGYFVMNDVLRYLVDDIIIEEDAVHYESAPSAGPTNNDKPVQATESSAQEVLPSSMEQDATNAVVPRLDSSLEQLSREQSEGKTDEQLEDRATVSKVNGHAPVDRPNVSSPAVKEAQDAAKEDDLSVEKPSEPVPTPRAASPSKQTTDTAASTSSRAPSKPAGPKTWANLVAASRPAVPAMPSMPKAITQKSAPRAGLAANPGHSEEVKDGVSSATETTAEPSATAEAAPDNDTEAARDSAHRRPRISMSREINPETTAAYIKNVSSNVNHDELRRKLTSYGELTNFFVHTQKNCAFVDFASSAAFRSAVADNPHIVSGESVIVDERRFKHPNGQYGPYSSAFSNRGRGGFGANGGPHDGKSPFPSHEGMVQGRGGYNTLPENGQVQYPVNRGNFHNRGRGNMRGRGARGGAPIESRS